MRVHLAVTVYVLVFAFRMGFTRGELACLFLTIGVVMGMEAINTSVEKLCDFTQKHWNPWIRKVKDIAAGGVLLSALAAVFVGVFLFFRPELLLVLQEFAAKPRALCLLLFSLPIALVFVFAGPVGIAEWIKSLCRKK